MPRVREITLDNLKLRITPLSWDEAEAYIEEGKEMLARKPQPSTQEWARRTLKSVVRTLKKAAGEDVSAWDDAAWDKAIKDMAAQYDMVTIQEIYEEFMKMSGLMTRRSDVPGEALATSTSS